MQSVVVSKLLAILKDKRCKTLVWEAVETTSGKAHFQITERRVRKNSCRFASGMKAETPDVFVMQNARRKGRNAGKNRCECL